MTSPFAHLDISEAFRNYIEGAIDRREYLSRRYAEDTDAQAEALGRFPSVPVIGDDRRVGASGGDDLREKNDG